MSEQERACCQCTMRPRLRAGCACLCHRPAREPQTAPAIIGVECARCHARFLSSWERDEHEVQHAEPQTAPETEEQQSLEERAARAYYKNWQSAEARIATLEKALRRISDDGECSCRDNDHDHGNAACALSIARAALSGERQATTQPCGNCFGERVEPGPDGEPIFCPRCSGERPAPKEGK